MEKLKEYGDVSKVQWKQCNLEHLEETRQVAEELKKELFRLDALVLNAGLGVGMLAMTTMTRMRPRTDDIFRSVQ